MKTKSLVQYRCMGRDRNINQRFVYDPRTNLIINPPTRQCLQVSGPLGRNGSRVRLERCNPNSLAQKFQFQRVRGRGIQIGHHGGIGIQIGRHGGGRNQWNQGRHHGGGHNQWKTWWASWWCTPWRKPSQTSKENFSLWTQTSKEKFLLWKMWYVSSNTLSSKLL